MGAGGRALTARAAAVHRPTPVLADGPSTRPRELGADVVDRGRRAEFGIQLLGDFGVRRDGERLPLRHSVQRLVALLAVEGGVDRRDAAMRLFDEVPAERALGNLRTVLSRAVRDAPGLVAQRGGELRVEAGANDYEGVVRWSAAVLGGTADGAATPLRAGRDLLPSWSDAWLVEPREQLHLLQVHALEASAEALLLAGRFGQAADCALRAACLDPLRESAHRLLVEVLLREGNVAEALRRYHRFERTLAREVGAPPGAALQALIAPLVAAGCTYPRGPSRRPR